jgi:hypothetical protein
MREENDAGILFDLGGLESIRVPSDKVWTPDLMLFK